MLFTSLEFLFLFLPFTLAGYYLLRRELRNLFLLGASLVFYAWGEPKFVLVMMASIVLNYLFALGVSALKDKRGCRAVLAVAIVSNLGLIFIYKYNGFLQFANRCGQEHLKRQCFALKI